MIIPQKSVQMAQIGATLEVGHGGAGWTIVNIDPGAALANAAAASLLPA
jgi:hypothetical protein